MCRLWVVTYDEHKRQKQNCQVGGKGERGQWGGKLSLVHSVGPVLCCEVWGSLCPTAKEAPAATGAAVARSPFQGDDIPRGVKCMVIDGNGAQIRAASVKQFQSGGLMPSCVMRSHRAGFGGGGQQGRGIYCWRNHHIGHKGWFIRSGRRRCQCACGNG